MNKRNQRRVLLMVALLFLLVVYPNGGIHGRSQQPPQPKPVLVSVEVDVDAKPIVEKLPNGGKKEIYKNKKGQVFREDESNGADLVVKRKDIYAIYPNEKEARVRIQTMGVFNGKFQVIKDEDIGYGPKGEITFSTTYLESAQPRIKIEFRDGKTYKLKWDTQYDDWDLIVPGTEADANDKQATDKNAPGEKTPGDEKNSSSPEKPSSSDTPNFEQPPLPRKEVFTRPEEKPKEEKPKEEKPSPKKLEEASGAIAPTASRGYQINSSDSSGVDTVSLTTPYGKIQLYIADDLSAGDTTTGTIEKEPDGKTDAERAKNLSELDRYSLELAQQQTSVGDNTFVRTLPKTLTDADRTIRLLRQGHEVAKVGIPVSSSPPPPSQTFTVPTGGQQGRLIEIPGRFDGSFSGTDAVKLGNKVIHTLTESPRRRVSRDDSDDLGPTTVTLIEHGNSSECPFRNIGISLTADKLNLLKGETTTLHIKVLGLKALTESVKLEVTNYSPGVISMAGGNQLSFSISPEQVAADGTFSVDRTLSSIMAGNFNITATVYWDRSCEAQASVSGDK